MEYVWSERAGECCKVCPGLDLSVNDVIEAHPELQWTVRRGRGFIALLVTE
jgi:hypothetical protein